MKGYTIPKHCFLRDSSRCRAGKICRTICKAVIRAKSPGVWGLWKEPCVRRTHCRTSICIIVRDIWRRVSLAGFLKQRSSYGLKGSIGWSKMCWGFLHQVEHRLLKCNGEHEGRNTIWFPMTSWYMQNYSRVIWLKDDRWWSHETKLVFSRIESHERSTGYTWLHPRRIVVTQ